MTQLPPEILLLAPLPGLEEAPPEITCHRLFDAPDPVAFLRAHGRRFRGVAASGRSLVDQALLAHLPSLEIIASFGVGYDRIDLDAVKLRGIVVTNTPDILTEEVADLALGLVIATTRRMPQAERYLRAGAWTSAPFPLSPSLRGRTAGIFGLGRIGKAIASRLEACGVGVAYHGRSRQHDVPYAYHASLEEMARAVDIMILAAPGGPQTLHAIDRTILQALGPQGILINIGRGSLVDEDALCEALEDGTILAAGLDVFENEPRVPTRLLGIENAVLLPHIGSASTNTRQAMGHLVRDNLLSWFRGDGPLTPVSETPWPARPAKER